MSVSLLRRLDHVLILRIEERLRPGIVDWSRVSIKPRSIYQRAENCNYALEVARQLQLRTVGIAGQDIADGNRKLTLALVWQLMRSHLTAFLATLRKQVTWLWPDLTWLDLSRPDLA